MGRLTTEVLPRERLALQPSGSGNGRGDPRGVWLVTAGIYRAVTVLATGERGRAFTAISPGILPPLAIMFAVLVGFLAAQDWGDFDRANAAVNREARSGPSCSWRQPCRASPRHGSPGWSRAISRT